MFDNIGRKIKTLTVVVCIIGIFASVIGAIALWAVHDEYHNPTIGTGFIVLVAGCAGSWIGSFFVYGFGQLIENSDSEVALLRKIESKMATAEKVASAKETAEKASRPAAPKKGWRCIHCGYDYNAKDANCCYICGVERLDNK